MAEIDLSKYMTQPPPFLAGIDRLSQAISDIWNKRKADEELRIQAATQEAQQRNWEASAASGLRTDLETARHNMAQEAYDRGKLRRDLTNDQMAYINNVAKAWGEGQFPFGDALAANSGLFGIAPRAMAAPTFDGSSPEPGVNLPPTPAASTEGVAPGVPRMAPAFPQQAADAVAAERGVAPPAPAVTGQAPPQTELNTPKPAPPAQPPPEVPPAPGSPGAVSPYAQPPVVPAQASPPPAAPVVPPAGSVRREDIHIQSQPQAMLGQYNPVPAGPAELPPTPWQGDLSKHPTVLEANPYWEGSRPSTAPGAPSVQYPTVPGPALPSGQPGAVAGAAPGAVDPATGRQWLARGIAGPVLPDRNAFMTNAAQTTQQAMERMGRYARDEYETELAQNAARAVGEASQFMSPEEAYKQVSTEFFKGLDMHRHDRRSELNATAQAGRAERVESRIAEQNEQARIARERQFKLEKDREARLAEQARLVEAHRQRLFNFAKGKDYVTRNKEALKARGLDKDVIAQQQLAKIQDLLANPSPTNWGASQSGMAKAAGEVGAMSNQDIDRIFGAQNRAVWKTFMDNVSAAIKSDRPYALADIRGTAEDLERTLNARTLNDYRFLRNQVIATAPNDEARKAVLTALRTNYQPFRFSAPEFELEERGFYLKPGEASPGDNERGPGMGPLIVESPPEIGPTEDGGGGPGPRGATDPLDMSDEEYERRSQDARDAVQNNIPDAIVE